MSKEKEEIIQELNSVKNDLAKVISTNPAEVSSVLDEVANASSSLIKVAVKCVKKCEDMLLDAEDPYALKVLTDTLKTAGQAIKVANREYMSAKYVPVGEISIKDIMSAKAQIASNSGLMGSGRPQSSLPPSYNSSINIDPDDLKDVE